MYGGCRNFRTEVEDYESMDGCLLYPVVPEFLFPHTVGKKLTLNLLVTFLSFYNFCLCSIIVCSRHISHIYQVCSIIACSIIKFAIIPFYNSGFHVYNIQMYTYAVVVDIMYVHNIQMVMAMATIVERKLRSTN